MREWRDNDTADIQEQACRSHYTGSARSRICAKIDMENIGRMMGGSITQSLIGIVPNRGKTLEDYRAERLSKYERID
jgi:hypothetical protein